MAHFEIPITREFMRVLDGNKERRNAYGHFNFAQSVKS